jgi:hypothetical protein
MCTNRLDRSSPWNLDVGVHNNMHIVLGSSRNLIHFPTKEVYILYHHRHTNIWAATDNERTGHVAVAM